MPEILSKEDRYINEFHRKSSEASQKEVESMMKHPYSLEEKLAQAKRRIKLQTDKKPN